MKLEVNSKQYTIPDLYTNSKCNYRSLLELIVTTNLALADSPLELFLTSYFISHARVMLVADESLTANIPWLSSDVLVVKDVRYEDLELHIPMFEKEGEPGTNGANGRDGKQGKQGPQGKQGYRGFSGFSL